MSRKVHVRKASPESETLEATFKNKLAEIRKQREEIPAKQQEPKVFINGKIVLERRGDWALMNSRSSGKKYYFNIKTSHNQWNEPDEWAQFGVKRAAAEDEKSKNNFQMTFKKVSKKNKSPESSSSSSSSSSDTSPIRSQLPATTWFTDYNFPASLSRCKFPKKSEILTELEANRYKTGLTNSLSFNLTDSARVISQELFISELKVPAHRYRLLSDKLGKLVYKIPDDLWGRYLHLFSIELFPGRCRLVSRPHGLCESGTPVYMRTGKVANIKPFPEDIVRCHAVLQAFRVQTCALVYANKNYEISRDDSQWEKDLEEAKNFLRVHGF